MEKLIIVGGGIGGLALAAGLKKLGMEVPVLEAAAEIRPVGAGIVLAHNAQLALQHLGVYDTLKPRGMRIEQGTIRDNHGQQLSQSIALAGDHYWLCIHRGHLHQGLMEHLSPDQVKLDARVIRAEVLEDRVVLHGTNGQTWTAEHVIAFDGIHSAVRKAVAPSTPTRYAGYTCWRGIVHDWQPDSLREAKEFTEVWGRGRRFGIVPIGENKTYWFSTLNGPQDDPNFAQYKNKELQEVFREFYEPVQESIARTKPEHIFWNDILDIPPPTQLAYGRVILAGDAGHATTPNMGQGAGMALEDAATLAQLFKEALDWNTMGQQYETLRLERTRWITRNSWTFGRVGQWQNPLAAGLRNKLMRAAPASASQKPLKKLASVNFGT